MTIRLQPGEEEFIRALRRLQKSDRINLINAATPAPRTIKTRAEMRAGQGFDCTATPPCSKQLKTALRAASHSTRQNDLQSSGHFPG